MLLSITAFVLVAFIVILLSRIEISISYKRLNSDDRLTIILKLFKIRLYKFDISMLDVSKGENGLGIQLMANKLKKRPKDEGKGFVHFETIANIYKDIKKYYKLYTETLNSIKHSLIRSTLIKEINISVKIGAFDHALTGMVTGLIYAFIWNAFSLIANNVKTKTHNISVTPRFDKNIFNLNLFCIFKIRIGNIIYVAIRLIALLIIHKILNNKKIKKTGINLNIN